MISICSASFGQIRNDLTCLSTIIDTIKIRYQADKFIVKLNDQIITNGQEFCFATLMLKSIDIYKYMSLECPEKVETITIDLKIGPENCILEPKYYLSVDVMPEFYGGMSKLLNFIGENFQYPQDIDACCKIYIQFTVSETGKLRDIKIVRSLQELFDKELIRVFSIMPDWKPGELNGVRVPVRMTLPIDFTLK